MHSLPRQIYVFRAFVALFLTFSVARAANFYITQNSLGAGTGADAANALPVTFFNTASNWSSPAKVAGSIGPGDTVHLCGAITTALTVQASGTSGNVITILFEPGAKLSAPTWNSGAGIEIGYNSYITVDGGATGMIGGRNGNPSLANGVIECTANGTGLANQNNDNGIDIRAGSNITVKGLVFQNIYVRTPGGTDANKFGSGFSMSGWGSAANITCTNCIFHDMSTGGWFGYRGSCANYVMSYCTAYNTNWGGAGGNGDGLSSLNGLVVDHCYFYNWLSWSSTDSSVTNALHHNGFYAWAEGEVSGSLTNLTYSNNFCGPGFGNNATAALFISGMVSSILINNNTCISDSTGNPGEGLIFLALSTGSTQQAYARIYNNTLVSTDGGIGINTSYGSGPSLTTYEVKNNVISGLGTAMARFANGGSTLIADYNVGYNLLPGQEYSDSSSGSANFESFTQWQNSGQDAHGSNGSPNLNSSYVPQSPSVAIGAGINLSSYFTSDANGNNRPPSSAAWDLGAFQFGSTAPNTNVAPTITTQPASQSVSIGASVTFTVAASGTPAPTFQWQKNGASIPGATGATLVLSNVNGTNDGTYTAVATNSAGTVTSSGAVLTVNSGPTSTPPTFTTQPTSLTVTSGATASFTVAASGTPAPTFQWRCNGTNIPGATGAALTLSRVTSANAGTYTAVATNSAGTVTSSGAVLTVTPVVPPATLPVFTTQPISQTVLAGAQVAFTVAASGTPAPTFQWQKNGINLSGSTGATLTLNSVTSANAGTYAVVATNSAGSTTSNVANLTVSPISVPTFTPGDGTYTSAQSVTIGSTTAGVSIVYTTDGSTPTESGGTVTSGTLLPNGGAVSVNANGVLKAIAFETGFTDSSVSTAAYVIQVATPTLSPGAGTYTSVQSVTIRTATSGASIAYTLDGTTPTQSGGTVTHGRLLSNGGSVSISASSTLNAIAFENGFADSAVATAAYVIYIVPTNLTQLTNQTVATGHTAEFVASSTGNPPPAYQWQVLSGSTWTNISNGVSYSGVTTNELAITGGLGLNGNQYRYVASNLAGAVNSNPITLTVVAAQFPSPTCIVVDPVSGLLYVGDSSNNTIQEINSSWDVSLVAGGGGAGTSSGSTDGTGSAALFHDPTGIFVNGTGTLYVADTGNSTIRQITSGGVVTTFAGSSVSPPGFTNGTGVAASFNLPVGLALDGSGNLYIADSKNAVIRKITPGGVVSTFAASALFNSPYGIAVDKNSGNIYVSDTRNYTILQITPSGVVTTLAGLLGNPGSSDGTGNNARFNSPNGLAVDGAGNIYVADTGNSTIRQIARTTGIVTTLAGLPGIAGLEDGNGTNSSTGPYALFNQPEDLTVDTSGNIYVADTGNAAIRKITPGGIVTTLAVTAANSGGSGASGGSPSSPSNPSGSSNPIGSSSLSNLSSPSNLSNPSGSSSPSSTAADPSGTGGGGGGAMEPWFICALATLALARRASRRC